MVESVKDSSARADFGHAYPVGGEQAAQILAGRNEVRRIGRPHGHGGLRIFVGDRLEEAVAFGLLAVTIRDRQQSGESKTKSAHHGELTDFWRSRLRDASISPGRADDGFRSARRRNSVSASP